MLVYHSLDGDVTRVVFAWTAPFDAIIVTAGAPHVPAPLLEQLKPGGRIIIPVGPASAEQQLMLVEKRLDGRIRKRVLGPVVFVPLTGAGAR